jgi:hypothetical protein
MHCMSQLNRLYRIRLSLFCVDVRITKIYMCIYSTRYYLSGTNIVGTTGLDHEKEFKCFEKDE